MWNLFKKYPLFFIIVLFLGFGAIAFTQPPALAKNKPLFVGLQSGYPPFEWMDSKGNITGFDVALSKILAHKLGRELVVKDMEFEGLILSLKQGKIDLILSGMNITPSRLKEILMVPYHGEAATHLSLLFWGEIPKGVTKLEDIAKLTHGAVSVESGAIPELYMSRFPMVAMKSFQGALAPLMDVKFGKSTANLVEADVASFLQMQHPEISIIEVPLSPEEHILGFGIGINKENLQLFQQITEIIQDLKQTGELGELEQQWFKGGL